MGKIKFESIDSFDFKGLAEHERTSCKEALLLKMANGSVFPSYAVGYYEEVHDVFFTRFSPGWDKSIGSVPVKCGEYRVNIPYKYAIPKGRGAISGIIRARDAFESLNWRNDFEHLDASIGKTYLLVTDDDYIMLSHVSSFSEVGLGFSQVKEASLTDGDKRALVCYKPFEEIKWFALIEE